MIYANFKKIDQIKVGDEGMVVADFSGVSAGTKFRVKEHYGKGVMVAWEGESHKNFRGEQDTDGFGEDELHYLAFKGLPNEKEEMYMVKTSRALTGQVDEPFRLEEKEEMFDLIWQANGPEEEIAMLISLTDLLRLSKTLNDGIVSKLCTQEGIHHCSKLHIEL